MPKPKNTVIPRAIANMKIRPTGLTYCGIFVAMYAMTIPGTAIMIKSPAIVGSVVLSFPMNAAAPNPRTMDITTKTVAFVLFDVDTPPSRIPALKKINPMKNKRPVSACIPSMNVCANPEYDVTRPAIPIAVSPPPGMTNSQLLIYAWWNMLDN